jgi:uncharacterized protein
MKELTQSLVNLQYIDSRIDELKRLRGDLPEEILDIEFEIDRTRNQIVRLEVQEVELTRERSNLEQEIHDSHNLVAKYESQQMSVRNNREYDALTKEIESQKQSTDNNRSRLEEIEIILRDSKVELEALRIDLDRMEADLETKKLNLDEVVAKTQSEEEMLIGKRDEAKVKIEVRFLRSYERLRNGLTNGLAVVAMERGSCLGMMLPPQVQLEVRKMSKIVIDENSGRIVVDPEFFDNAKQELSI